MRNGDHLTPIVGRLAPTPSGRLHLGNACAAAAAWLSIRQRDGRLLLRIEDVDEGRARPATNTSTPAERRKQVRALDF